MKKGQKSKDIMYMQNLKAQDQIIELEIEKKKRQRKEVWIKTEAVFLSHGFEGVGPS